MDIEEPQGCAKQSALAKAGTTPSWRAKGKTLAYRLAQVRAPGEPQAALV